MQCCHYVDIVQDVRGAILLSGIRVWNLPTSPLYGDNSPFPFAIKSYGTRNCNFKCNLRRQRGNAFPNHQHLKQMTPEHCKELAARWGRSPPPIHMRHLKTKPAKESIIRSQGGAQFLAWARVTGSPKRPGPGPARDRAAPGFGNNASKCLKRTTESASGTCPHHHFMEATIQS